MSSDTTPQTPTHRRSETDADTDFLLQLFASTRADEMALLPLAEAQKNAFLEMQFRAQRSHYRTQYPDAEFWVLERAGDRIGRLYVARQASEIHVIDITLLPGARGRGVGTAILRALQAEAASRSVPLRLHVTEVNPARRLYERLGFVTITCAPPYMLLEWSASLGPSRP